ncbi:MAG: cell division protein FtsA [Acidiferrobacterales bacterium]|nr:cell division protein FtsA [Acidiferrobacterales bacterium]
MGNSRKSENQFIVGLDVGTSKIAVVVCEVSPVGDIEVIGVAEQPALGMDRGMVSNIDLMVRSIKQAIAEAETMADCEIVGVFAGITGAHIRSYNSSGVVAIKGGEVSQDDLSRVIEAAQAVRISSDEKILHVLPQNFSIDDQDGIRDPVGLCGVRLEANVHVITGNISAVQNILKCIKLCDLEVVHVILDHIASGESVLTDDEKELGVGMLDIGDGTMDLAVYCEGALQYSVTFSMAGSQITNDIAVTMHTPTSSAKKIKHRYGSAIASTVDGENLIELPGIGDQPVRSVRQKYLAEVIESRMEELFHLVLNDLNQTNNISMLRSGMVLTGGGSRLEEVVPLAERILNLPTRLGLPRYAGPLCEVVNHPMFATGLGLCQFGCANRDVFGLTADDSTDLHSSAVNKLLEYARKLYTRPEPEWIAVQPTDGRLKG